MSEFHLPLVAEDREVAAELQAVLVDLIDLALIGQQAHWNVIGPHFRSLHAELDELVGAWRALGDEVAERAVALGAAPDGQAEMIAGATEIEPLPGGHLNDSVVVEAIGQRLGGVARRTRGCIDRTAADPVTQDLLIAVAGALDKQLWMLQAQRVTQHHEC